MSFGAFGGRKEIMKLYDPRTGTLEHPGTFNNNTFTMTAGVAGCNLLTPQAIDALNDKGNGMHVRIAAVLSSRAIEGTIPSTPVTDDMHSPSHPRRPPKMFVKGVGSILAIHFAGPDKELLQGLFYHHMLEQEIFMAQRGFIALNIMLKDEHVSLFVRAVELFCDRWESILRW